MEPSSTEQKRRRKFSPDEEDALKCGVEKYGHGKWRLILKDPELKTILKDRSNIDLKDKWRNLSIVAMRNGDTSLAARAYELPQPKSKRGRRKAGSENFAEIVAQPSPQQTFPAVQHAVVDDPPSPPQPEVMDDPPSTQQREVMDDPPSPHSPQQSEAHQAALPQRKRGACERLEKAHPMTLWLAEAGTSFENGQRRSKRIRMEPLKYWKGEKLVQGRVGDGLELLGVKYCSPGDGSLKVKSYVSDEYKELLEIEARYA